MAGVKKKCKFESFIQTSCNIFEIVVAEVRGTSFTLKLFCDRSHILVAPLNYLKLLCELLGVRLRPLPFSVHSSKYMMKR